ncbi:IclR family transcriptional regulator C-terminal domain-containing protein [Pseudarthrobacter sp. WHRI 8279]|uniref:IclR family transcriptional regulator domain-containing protein n=1 Tax=Pseudarthrobacter sp. WHRI 8279 TaxID=3162566 RepID=UPI0035A91FD9
MLRDIHDATRETVFLCIRSGPRAVCIERFDGKRASSRRLALGSSLPLHTGAAPRTLLAFDTPSPGRSMQRSWAKAPTLASAFDPERNSMQKIKEIRDAGFALSDDEVTLRMAAVSAPIFDHRGDVMASLPVSGLRDAILHQPDSSSSIIDLAREGGTTAFNLFWCPRVPHLASLTQPRLLHPALPAGRPKGKSDIR